MIISAAEYCMKNNQGNENEIGKILDKLFYGEHINLRIAIFLLVNEIFLASSRNADKSFLKALSQRVRMFISDLASSDDQRADVEIVNAIEKWSSEGVFHPNFIKRLKEAAVDII